MIVAVTGASGFVGKRLVGYLGAQGVAVRAVSRGRVEALPENAEWIQSPDLGPDADWREAVSGADIVVHLAARVHVMRDVAADPVAAYRRDNVAGTLALANAAVKAGVKRFVFVSSIKVNGEATVAGAPFRVDDPIAPTDPYGISKAEAESALQELGRKTGMEIVIIRPVLVYGPGVGANFGTMMRAVSRGIPLPLGNATNRRSLIFVDNLADLVSQATRHPQAAGRIFLAADSNALSIAHMVRELGVALGRPARLLPVPPRLVEAVARAVGMKGIAQRLFGALEVDAGDAYAVMGWEPPFTTAQGFARTAESFLGSKGQA